MKNLKGNVCLFVFLKSNKEKTDWERRQRHKEAGDLYREDRGTLKW